MKQISGTTIQLRQRNRLELLKILLLKKQATRNQLTATTGFSYSTIGNLLSDLEKEEFIKVSDEADSTGGRKPKIIRLNPDKAYFVALDLSDMAFYWAISDLTATAILKEKLTLSPSENITVAFRNNLDRIRAKCEEMGITNKIMFFGVSIPGYLNEEKGTIVSASHEELEKISLIPEIQNITNAEIIVRNDANIAAFNEVSSLSRVQNVDIFYLLIIKKGIGSAIIINNELYIGTSGIAGEIHQTPIYLKNRTILMGEILSPEDNLKEVSTQLGKEVKKEDFFELYKQKNPLAIDIYNNILEAMSTGLIFVNNLLNPSHILISGFYNEYGNKLLNDIRQKFRETSEGYYYKEPNIAFAHYHEDIFLEGITKYMISKWISNLWN